jgi:antirestriction protein ArdC
MRASFAASKVPVHPDWSQLLIDAVNKPGVISTAYSAFWNYSTSNQLLALFECLARSIEPGPIHTFGGWLKFNRHVRKGEKAITLCVPRTVKRKPLSPEAADTIASDTSSGDGGERSNGEATITVFAYRPHWFVLSQTDGESYVPLAIPEWDEALALHVLQIDRVPFHHTDGNCQGYATGRSFAVSPVAYLPHRTCFHELAHIVLGHTLELQGLSDTDERTPRDVREVEAEAVSLICCQSLGLSGERESRGYLQHWLGRQRIEERSAQRIFKAADTILRAGRPTVPAAESDDESSDPPDVPTA